MFSLPAADESPSCSFPHNVCAAYRIGRPSRKSSGIRKKLCLVPGWISSKSIKHKSLVMNQPASWQLLNDPFQQPGA
jgi:hypothetical protein